MASNVDSYPYVKGSRKGVVRVRIYTVEGLGV